MSTPEYGLRLTGTLSMTLVINLATFVAEQDDHTFRHVRGSEYYATALRSLHPTAPFGLDEHAVRCEQDSYRLRIFRSRLLANHFFPTYRLGWDASMRAHLESAGFKDIERWMRWNVRVRLTRNGLAVILLEQPIENVPLIAWSERVLELQPQDRNGNPSEDQDQWTLGMLILEAFLESIERRMYVRIDQNTDLVVHFGRPRTQRHSVRLDRYVIYSLRGVTDQHGLIAPDRLKHEYAATLAGFMEGALVEVDGQRRLPRYAADHAATLAAHDMSTWDEELCLFTGESALIYCPLVGRGVAYIGGPLGLSGHAYARYWEGIIRGIQHIIAFHAEIQQTERRTTSLLGAVPLLTRRVNEGDLTREDIEQIDHLATSLSDIFASLPEQRSMAVSSNAFRADYARTKFAALMQELDVQETLDLVNTNVEQLNFFLSYYGDMRLQWQGQRTNDTNTLISEIVMFMALSSFTADTFQVGNALGLSTAADIVLVAAILVVLGLVLGIGWLRRIIRLRRR